MKVVKCKNGFLITGSKEQCDAFENKFKLMQFCDRTLTPTTRPWWWR